MSTLTAYIDTSNISSQSLVVYGGGKGSHIVIIEDIYPLTNHQVYLTYHQMLRIKKIDIFSPISLTKALFRGILLSRKGGYKMKLKEAREIGKSCNLKTDIEYIKNIEIHACNLFAYTDIEKELIELYEDAIGQDLLK